MDLITQMVPNDSGIVTLTGTDELNMPKNWNSNLIMSRQSTIQGDPNKLLVNPSTEEENKEEELVMNKESSSYLGELLKEKYFNQTSSAPGEKGKEEEKRKKREIDRERREEEDKKRERGKRRKAGRER